MPSFEHDYSPELIFVVDGCRVYEFTGRNQSGNQREYFWRCE